MTAAFARLENRVNRAVMQHLVNAEAQLSAGGEPFGVVYDAPAAVDAFDGQVDTIAPVCLGTAQDLSTLERGSTLIVNGTTFVVERVEPDGTGLVRAILREA